MDPEMEKTLVTKVLQPSKRYHLAKAALQSQLRQNGHKEHNFIRLLQPQLKL